MSINLYEVDHEEKGPMSAKLDAYFRRKARVEFLESMVVGLHEARGPDREIMLEGLVEAIVQFLDAEANTGHFRQ